MCPLLRPLLCGLSLLVVGCSAASPHGLSWGVDFRDDDLRGRALLVEAEVREGGCSGPAVFSSRVTSKDPGTSPSDLPEGRYGFYARARDENCTWFAEGCTQAELPTDTSLTVVLSELAEPELDEACVPGMEKTERATRADDDVMQPPLADGGTSNEATREDSSPRGPEADGGGSPNTALEAQDAGAIVTPQVNASEKCNAIDAAIVACYDFDSALRDASSYRQNLKGQRMKYEASPTGQALRVGGNLVSVVDDASLDLDRFTIEFFLRADNLTNLLKEQAQVSVLLDKDQQYLVGFSQTGALLMELYGDNKAVKQITTPSMLLSVGSWAYVGFVYDGVSARFYLDGVLVYEEAVSLTLAKGAGVLTVGSGSPSGTHPFDGLIDALRVSNVARDPSYMCAAAGKSYSSSTCI